MNEANNTVSQLKNKLNDATNKNETLQKELDTALQEAKDTQAHAEEVLKQNN